MSNTIVDVEQSTVYSVSNPYDTSEVIEIIEVTGKTGKTIWFIEENEERTPLYSAEVYDNKTAIKIWYSQSDEEATELTIENIIKPR
ncbi:hypothetical protein D5018_19600 [Parashewanella curva]|uniref:Uncharacterized protein n=1 Tax=Parashewanella curva TaxID=2338552 RepID=A0A3L8PRF9_9GAMM|nr:hypothetical protein [Parashewanella curva]RLV57987.1 hypothetical protein D5018_19600 [Parashewanella curva]